MKLGVVYPQTELRGDPHAVRQIGLALETLGFDHLLTYDHVLGATHDREPRLTGPYTNLHPFHDPLVMFSHLAAITHRLEFVTGILILPQRQTALVARQCADLDLLSGQRFRLGVGVGWNYVEYEALGESFKTRGRRLSEQVGLLRRLWSEPLVSFAGEFDRIDRACLNPRPRRLIPIWFGGFTDPAFERAARMGDGFIFTGSVERLRDGWARVEHFLTQAGRAPSEFGKEMIVGRAEKTAAEIAARIADCRERACTHAAIDTMGRGLTSAQAHIDLIAEVRARIGAAT